MALSSFSQTFDPQQSLSGYERSASYKSVVFCWGRFQPPTKGHQVIFDKAYDLALESTSRLLIFTSQTQDEDSNPLSYDQKIKYLRLLFPKYTVSVVKDESIRTIIDVCVSLYEKGYRKATLVVGSDRVDDFKKQLNHYNGKRSSSSPERYYNFIGGINVVQGGAVRSHDQNSNDIIGISGTQARKYARSGKFDKFLSQLPDDVYEKYARELYIDIRQAYGLGKTSEVNLSDYDKQPEDHIRNEFFSGKYKVNDTILFENSLWKISSLGPNYINIKSGDITKKVWPSQVTLIS